MRQRRWQMTWKADEQVTRPSSVQVVAVQKEVVLEEEVW